MASRLETSENVSSMYLRANFEHIHPELASAELAAIFRLQNEIKCGGTSDLNLSHCVNMQRCVPPQF